jgi:hypothetical protein
MGAAVPAGALRSPAETFVTSAFSSEVDTGSREENALFHKEH